MLLLWRRAPPALRAAAAVLVAATALQASVTAVCTTDVRLASDVHWWLYVFQYKTQSYVERVTCQRMLLGLLPVSPPAVVETSHSAYIPFPVAFWHDLGIVVWTLVPGGRQLLQPAMQQLASSASLKLLGAP